MPSYKCKNKNCTLYNIEIDKEEIIRIIDNEEIDISLICTECGKLGIKIKHWEENCHSTRSHKPGSVG